MCLNGRGEKRGSGSAVAIVLLLLRRIHTEVVERKGGGRGDGEALSCPVDSSLIRRPGGGRKKKGRALHRASAAFFHLGRIDLNRIARMTEEKGNWAKKGRGERERRRCRRNRLPSSRAAFSSSAERTTRGEEKGGKKIGRREGGRGKEGRARGSVSSSSVLFFLLLYCGRDLISGGWWGGERKEPRSEGREREREKKGRSEAPPLSEALHGARARKRRMEKGGSGKRRRGGKGGDATGSRGKKTLRFPTTPHLLASARSREKNN